MNTTDYITIEEEIPERMPVTKTSFSDFFNEKLERLNSAANKPTPDSPALKKRDIADMIGVSYEVFRKYINREKPTERRDCIIAICAVLGATAAETNEGLYYYGMDELAKGWKRDEALIELIGNDEKPRTVEEINDGLIEKGFEELDIIHHKGRPKAAAKKIKFPYKLKRKKVEIPEIDYTDEELHFVTRFDIILSTVRTFMEFSDEGTPITIWTDIVDYDSPSGIAFMYCVHDPRLPYCQKYTELELTGDFMNCFEDLQKTAATEMKKLNKYYNDTKNFKFLTSARVIDNELHYFTEAYNQDLLLLTEYYLMDYCNGQLTMTVSSKSRFLRLFLTKEEYERRFPNNPDDIIAVYTEDPADCEDKKISSRLLSLRSKYYHELEDRLEQLLMCFYNNALAICGSPYPKYGEDKYSIFYSYPESIIEVKKAFDCITEKVISTSAYSSIKNISDLSELGSSDFLHLSTTPIVDGEDVRCGYYDEIVGVRNENPEFTLSGGEKVNLTVQDLIDGKNLDLETIDEVGYFKLKHGTLDIKKILDDDEHFVLCSTTFIYGDDNGNMGYEEYLEQEEERIDKINEKFDNLSKKDVTYEELDELETELRELSAMQKNMRERLMNSVNKKGQEHFQKFMN